MLYQPSMKSKTAIRASALGRKPAAVEEFAFERAKNDSHIALSKQSLTEPIDVRMPACTSWASPSNSTSRIPKDS